MRIGWRDTDYGTFAHNYLFKQTRAVNIFPHSDYNIECGLKRRRAVRTIDDDEADGLISAELLIISSVFRDG